jgi:ferric-dicitrate binding protein FerR (iron transport regulator)
MFGHLAASEIDSIAGGQPASPHLSSCGKCSAALKRAQSRRRLLGSMPEASLDEAAYARVERNLFSPARDAPRRQWFALPAFGLLAAAAVLAFVFLRPGSQPAVVTPPVEVVEVAAPKIEAPLALASLTPSLVQGQVEWRSGAEAPWAPLTVGTELTEGAELKTADGRAALALSEGRGLVVEAATDLKLGTLRVGKAQLELVAGQVVCSLTPLAHGESFTVIAGGRWISAVGTAFAVTRTASEVLVEVQHGVVAVSDGPLGSGSLVELTAPGRLRLVDGVPVGGAMGERLSPEAEAELRGRPAFVLAAGGAPPWARMDVRDLPAGVLVQIDELGWGPVPLSGLFPPGSHRVRAQAKGEAIRETWVDLVEGGAPVRVQLPKAALRIAVKPKPTADQKATEVLNAAVKLHYRELRACYERWLKKDFTAGGTVTLSLELSAEGEVTSARVDGAVLSQATAQCFADEARTWALPSFGESQVIELPLVLTTDR